MAAKETGMGFPWRVVTILTLLNILSYADRQLLSLLAVPIQESLKIDDVEIGLLQGLAFSVTFTLSSIPVGWAVDHFNRARIIFAGVGIWSVATMACGFASSFWQLFLCRIGVGTGEATLGPSAYAILSEASPKGRLASAMGVYAIGTSIGIALSLAGGGLVVAALAGEKLSLPGIGPIEAWQAAFLMLGAPGAVLAFTAFLLPTHAVVPDRARSTAQKAKKSVFRYIGQHRAAFFSQQIGFAMLGLSGYAVVGWAPAHLQRSFDWSLGLIGPVLGVAIGVSGLVGTLIASALADRASRIGRKDAYFVIATWTTATGAPLIVAAFLVGSGWLCVALLGIGYLIFCSFGGLAAASLQSMAPPAYRGRIAALYIFTLNILGLGLGPLLVGLLTEHVFGDRQMVGLSVATTVAIAASISLLCLVGGRRAYLRAVQAAEA